MEVTECVCDCNQEPITRVMGSCCNVLHEEMRLQFECSDIKNYTKSLKSNNELEPLTEDLEIAYMHTGQLVILVA